MTDAEVDRLAETRTIEITTTGRRSRRPVRVEIWWFRVEGRFIITGTPGPRGWLANLMADPRLVVHVGGRDYPAVASPVTDRAFRQRFFDAAVPEIAWYRSQADLVDLVDTSPMVEVRLDEDTPSYTTRLLDVDTWGDFARLVEANNGVWGGCWCMGFHPEGLGGTTAEQNREAKHAHVRSATVHQVLVYDGDQCVGWCQYGSPTELPNIKNLKAYQSELVELPDWRIGCLFTGKDHRGRGVARAAVLGALDAIGQAGGGVVEAYPEQVEDRKPQRGAYLHTGPEDLFAGLGFVRDRKIAKWRWVVRRHVQPSGPQ